MKHTLKIIFGKEQVIKAYNGVALNKEELSTNVKEFSFDTVEEKEAFVKGVQEAMGWTAYCIPEDELEDYFAQV
jgi:hypothetical protein